MGSQSILNLIDEAGEPRRGASRRRVMMIAQLSTSSAKYDVKIRDVSATGARIEACELPAEGTTVRLKRGTFLAYGRLVWVNGRSGGIAFDDAFDGDELVDLLKGLPAAPPAEPAPYRRPGFDRGNAKPRFSDGSGWIDWRSGN